MEKKEEIEKKRKIHELLKEKGISSGFSEIEKINEEENIKNLLKSFAKKEAKKEKILSPNIQKKEYKIKRFFSFYRKNNEKPIIHKTIETSKIIPEKNLEIKKIISPYGKKYMINKIREVYGL